MHIASNFSVYDSKMNDTCATLMTLYGHPSSGFMRTVNQPWCANGVCPLLKIPMHTLDLSLQ